MYPRYENIFTQLNRPESRAHLFTLAGIILLGFILRFYGFLAGESYHYFSINDEVSALRVAMSFLAGEEQAYYIGQPNFSNGHAPGPAFTLFWVMALKLAGNSVDYALLVMAAINTTVIFLIYRLALNFLQPAYALFACFMFATSPWPVYYGPGLWNPIPLALLGSILFLSLWQVSQKDDSRSIIWVCFIAAVIPHFHMVGIFYIPAILLILILGPAHLNRGWFVAGILLGFAVYLPYLAGELQNDWENTQKIITDSKGFSFSVLKIITAPAAVLSNHPGRWAGDDFAEFIEFADRWFFSYVLLLVINVISFVFSFAVIGWYVTRFAATIKTWAHPKQTYQQHPKLFFINIMLVLPLVLFLLTGHNYSTRYTILIFPILFLLPAFYLQDARQNKFKRFYTALLPLMILVNVYLPISFFTHQSQQIEDEEYLITSFRKLEFLRQHIKAHAGNNVFIKVDPSGYYEDAPVKYEKASKALANYIDIYETYTEHTRKPTLTKTYQILTLDKLTTSEANIAYKGNGFAITLK